MKNNFFLILFFLFSSCSLSIPEMSKNKTKINIEYEQYYLADSTLLLDLYFLIPYDIFLFIKNQYDFQSDVLFSIKLKDQDEDVIYSDSWSDSIIVNSFESTKSSKNYISNYSLTLNEEIFKKIASIYLEIDDYKNYKHWTAAIDLEIEESDLLSTVGLFVKNNDKYQRAIDYHDEENDTLWIKYQIVDTDINKSDLIISIEPKMPNFEENYMELTINQKEIKSYEINFIPIPINDISSDYLKVVCYYKDVKKETSISLPYNISIDYDYDLLIEPFQYLLNEQEYINYIGLTKGDKINFIKQYWANMENPLLLKEFYSRVQYSNLEFKSIRGLGSKSDKGKVYIVYGKPFDIEYQISESGDYQEIWVYRNKKFIFINRYGYYECYNC